MKFVLAFGDSNTWGLIPGSKCKERYPWEIRWTGILQNNCTNVRIIEEGLCGRTTAFEDDLRPGRKGISALPVILESQHPLDAAIVMLGTNDCKSAYSISANAIGKGIELCLDELERYLAPQNILLVSPIFLGENVWKPDKDPEFAKQSVITCRKLKEVYYRIAKERGTAFLAASDYVHANPADEEHMDEEGHRIFASVIYEKLEEMRVI
ncbi:MAG: arylesterase [Clostridia bacterium]|nr:arylesterase [Clostridia bacterium]